MPSCAVFFETIGAGKILLWPIAHRACPNRRKRVAGLDFPALCGSCFSGRIWRAVRQSGRSPAIPLVFYGK